MQVIGSPCPLRLLGSFCALTNEPLVIQKQNKTHSKYSLSLIWVNHVLQPIEQQCFLILAQPLTMIDMWQKLRRSSNSILGTIDGHLSQKWHRHTIFCIFNLFMSIVSSSPSAYNSEFPMWCGVLIPGKGCAFLSHFIFVLFYRLCIFLFYYHINFLTEILRIFPKKRKNFTWF